MKWLKKLTTKLSNSTDYSLKGLKAAWGETSIRLETYASFFIIPLGYYCAKDASEANWLVGSWLIVIIVELLNSAVEASVDRHGKEIHELSGKAKDIGSAAVFASILFAGLIWFNTIVLY